MTSCANAEQSESVGGEGYSTAFGSIRLSGLFWSSVAPFFSPLIETRLLWTKSEWKCPEWQPGQRKGNLSSTVRVCIPPQYNYESRSTVMRDKMSDTKVHVTDEQPWVAAGEDSTTQTTPKCAQVGTKMFTWSTTAMSRNRQDSRNIERKGGKE